MASAYAAAALSHLEQVGPEAEDSCPAESQFWSLLSYGHQTARPQTMLDPRLWTTSCLSLALSMGAHTTQVLWAHSVICHNPYTASLAST